jgi:UDP-N-acetylmuramate--alanine ligase
MKRFELSDLPNGAQIHFIGIGGISMSGLAQVVLQKGFKVTGSDRQQNHITEKLSQLGATVYLGHAAQNVNGSDLVVHTAAVHDDNPEMMEAKRQGLRLIDRAEFLGAVMKLYKHAVGVSGTHGKTTTTSMLAHAMVHAQTDPTISVGGELDLIGGNIRTGVSDYFVTEACEYTNSFLKFFPTIALITNVEEDHLDFFSGIGQIIESFRQFALLTLGKGSVVAWGEDPNVIKALDQTGCDIHFYGIGTEFEYHPEKLSYRGGFPSFDVVVNGQVHCHLQLNVPGEHNVLNALATIAVCELLGIDPETAARGIETFTGTRRRFERKGTLNGATVIDDYAHHPTEIKATISAARALDYHKMWCVFQPHTYTRTKTLWKDFLTCFDGVDELVLVDIYAAREPFDGETTSEGLAQAIAQAVAGTKMNVRYAESFEEAEKLLQNELGPGDIAFTMGAGDVVEIGEAILK